jgi:hypothetical protein
MKTFKNCAAQGDLLIIKINELPDKAQSVKAIGNKHIVAHSETGHHHVIEDEDVTYYNIEDDMMKAYLVVKNIIGAQLKHLRDFDTHETILIPTGIYELRRQREYVPEGWRRVED